MTRTPGDTARRRNLADAANGFLPTGRKRVALYACISDGRDPNDVLSELRTYAMARDWTVTAAVYDTGPLDRTTDRYALTRVARLLEDGAVDGIVARSEADVAASTKLGRSKLDAWLEGLDHPGFVDYLHKATDSPDDRGLLLDEAVRPEVVSP
ncbi:hypothetical protein ACFWBX_29520 [Streptomyces sp. NPDC059991]|uniref:hypothetical protein n=1 Tax=Streptomyces sp. NPDC059991 TaxID=3347028 RepID=UPI0036C694DE